MHFSWTPRSPLPQSATTIPAPQQLTPITIAHIYGEEYRRLEAELARLEPLCGLKFPDGTSPTPRLRKHSKKRLRDVRWKLEALRCPFQSDNARVSKADGGWTYARGTDQAVDHPAVWIERLLPNWGGIKKRTVPAKYRHSFEFGGRTGGVVSAINTDGIRLFIVVYKKPKTACRVRGSKRGAPYEEQDRALNPDDFKGLNFNNKFPLHPRTWTPTSIIGAYIGNDVCFTPKEQDMLVNPERLRRGWSKFIACDPGRVAHPWSCKELGQDEVLREDDDLEEGQHRRNRKEVLIMRPQPPS